MGQFSSECEVCGDRLTAPPMTWNGQGRNATVCGACNEKLRREAGRQALENQPSSNPPRGLGLFVMLGIGALACAAAAVFYLRSNHDAASTASVSPTVSPVATPTPKPPPPLTAQQKAIAKFPALGIKDSSLNQRFVVEYQRLQAANDPLLNNPEWPTVVAARCQAALNAEDKANHR